MFAVFKGNPKLYFMSCYSPHSVSPEEDVLQLYSSLRVAVASVPAHGSLQSEATLMPKWQDAIPTMELRIGTGKV